MKFPVLIAALILGVAIPVQAGPIESACLRADRVPANRAVCGCIQQVADQTLTGKDQRLAASFFGDPDRAQRIRQSDSASHSEFWDRYTSFGEAAEAYCAG